MSHPLIIVGWSARAAVQSARRAGFEALAIDAFLDADLRRDAVSCRRLGDVWRLAALTADLPPSDWLYVGGLENHPRIVAEVSRRHRLLGVGPETLPRVRDPFALQRAVGHAGFSFPETRSIAERARVPTNGTWLVKRRRSAGGVGLWPYLGSLSASPDVYFQQIVEGDSCGVTFVAAGGRSRFLGVCRQFSSTSGRGAPYLYGGSIGPLALSSNLADALQRLGELIAGEFELVGLFGVDVIIDRDETVWPLEVNPRYTASVELLERATGTSLLDLHLRACRDGNLHHCHGETQARTGSLTFPTYGKRIVYFEGPADCVVSPWLAEQLLAATNVADVPTAGTCIRRGDPLTTVFAAAATADEVERLLVEREQQFLESVRASQ